MRFTILAPHQARARAAARRRDLGGRSATAIDPSRAYLWRGPRGLSLALFFYDGPISRAIAFERRCSSAASTLVAWLEAAFSDARAWPQLVHCATDGESYGHHRRFGEMALAAARPADRGRRDRDADQLRRVPGRASRPPTRSRSASDTSWSCAHGVERWRADCGCAARGDWHQRWRAPAARGARLAARPDRPVLRGARGRLSQGPVGGARRLRRRRARPRARSGSTAFFARARARCRSTPAARARGAPPARARSATGCSCTPRAAGSSTRSRRSSPCRSSGTRRWRSSTCDDLGGGRLEDGVRRAGWRRRRATSPSFATAPRSTAAWCGPTIVNPSRVVAHYAITGLRRGPPDADARVYAYRVTPARRGARGVRTAPRCASVTSASAPR